MTTLEATAEIVKAAIQGAPQVAYKPEAVAKMIEAVYSKLKEVQSK